MVNSIARSSMPSSVQHGSTSPSATSPAPVVVDCGQLELGDEGWTGRTLTDHSASRAGQSDCRPAGLEACHRARRAGVGDDDQPVDIQVGRFGQPLGHRVRQRPVARAAAQGRGGLEPVGVGAGVELPRAELGQRWARQRLAEVRFGFGLLHQLVATGGLERPERLPAIFFGVVAEIEDHLAAANRARDSRMRCISMLPDDTVEACEYRQWSSTSPRNHFARGSSCDTSAAMSISTSALS